MDRFGSCSKKSFNLTLKPDHWGSVPYFLVEYGIIVMVHFWIGVGNAKSFVKRVHMFNWPRSKPNTTQL